MINTMEILNNCAELTGWKTENTLTKTYEMFFVKGKLETVRATDTEDQSVTVYVDHNGCTGDSSFSVSQAMDADSFKKALDKAVRRAKLICNEKYSLPNKESFDMSPEIDPCYDDPADLGADIANTVFSVLQGDNGTINALEIFITREEMQVCNSNGINIVQYPCRVMLEAIPTWTTEHQSVELYEDFRFVRFNRNEILREIQQKMIEVEARGKAQKVSLPETMTCIFRENEITDLMWSLADDVNYANVYAKGNKYKIGDVVQPELVGDALNIAVTGSIPDSSSARLFDSDGVVIKTTQLVKNGEVVGMYGANRFAQYLGEKVTGNACCIQVAAGTMSDSDELFDRYLDCVSLSGLQVDIFSDYIGGEVRLAYYHDGEQVIPVTGFSVSGSLSAVLSGLKLSTNCVTHRSYHGPDRLAAPDLTIS